MEKVAHGIYILDDVWPDELFVLQQRNKNIIYSGEAALYLHGLIDREYSHICFTVPTGYNATHGVYESLAEVGSNGEYCGGLINLKFR